MQIISFGDVHMALETIERLAPKLAAADLVILSGDLTNFGGRAEADEVLATTQRFARQLLALSGNLDQPEVISFLQESGVSLHGESRRYGDLGVFGCGGSNRTPFRTPTELSEEEIAGILQRAHANVADAPRQLMVCHTPPVNTATDRIASGQHVGSPTVRAFIERHQPDVCVTGHIHESAGVDHIGRTTIVNAGLLRDGGYVVVTMTPGGLSARLESL